MTRQRQSGRKHPVTGEREQRADQNQPDRPTNRPDHSASIHADARGSTPATWDAAGATWDAVGRTWDELHARVAGTIHGGAVDAARGMTNE